MVGIRIDIEDDVVYYGPYDITDYAAWQTDLEAGVTAGSKIKVIRYGNWVIFNEIRSA